MTSTLQNNDRNEERRRRVMLGPLPPGFLQTTPSEATVDSDYEIAVALDHQQMYTSYPQRLVLTLGRLSVTIVQAKLVKNYGLTRMDPYCRMRVGHCIYETHTDPSGGKTPRWNKVMHCLLPRGITSAYFEIFDECSFTMDELIAWTHITIPTSVFNGETHEDWYPLTGKQGDGVEGMINIVFSYAASSPLLPESPQRVVVVPNTGHGYAALPVYPAPAPGYPAAATQPAQPAQHGAVPAQQATYPPPVASPVTPEQMKQIEEMFPAIDKEVIKSVVEANNGNKDAAVNCLLAMAEN